MPASRWILKMGSPRAYNLPTNHRQHQALKAMMDGVIHGVKRRPPVGFLQLAALMSKRSNHHPMDLAHA